MSLHDLFSSAENSLQNELSTLFGCCRGRSGQGSRTRKDYSPYAEAAEFIAIAITRKKNFLIYSDAASELFAGNILVFSSCYHLEPETTKTYNVTEMRRRSCAFERVEQQSRRHFSDLLRAFSPQKSAFRLSALTRFDSFCDENVRFSRCMMQNQLFTMKLMLTSIFHSLPTFFLSSTNRRSKKAW